jgi:hypothetical protein
MSMRAPQLIVIAATIFIAITGCKPAKTWDPISESAIPITPEELATFINTPNALDDPLPDLADATLRMLKLDQDPPYTMARLVEVSEPDEPLTIMALVLTKSTYDTSEVLLFIKSPRDILWAHMKTLETMRHPQIERRQIGDLQWIVVTTTPGHGTGIVRCQADWYPLTNRELDEPFTYTPKAYHLNMGDMVMDVEYDSIAELKQFDDGVGLQINIDAIIDHHPVKGQITYRWNAATGTFTFCPERSEWTEEQFDALWNGTNETIQELFPDIPYRDK